jgi:type IV secretion system protein VirB10
MKKSGSLKSLLMMMAVPLFSSAGFAQAAPGLDDSLFSADTPLQAVSRDTVGIPSNAPSTLTIPAGTRVMMVLKSPLHTTSGTAGSGIYLETLFPVVQGDQVIVPAHTFVEGVVEGSRRPGHFHRTSEFRFRFTNLIFANNHIAPISGVLQSIPGAPNVRTHDKDGTLETVDQLEKVVTPTAGSSVGGAIVGSVHEFGIGTFTGAGLGAALGLGGVLLHRGDEISLRQGTYVEMVLQAPLALEQSQIAENARYKSALSTLPAAPVNENEERARKRTRRGRRPGLAEAIFAAWAR